MLALRWSGPDFETCAEGSVAPTARLRIIGSLQRIAGRIGRVDPRTDPPAGHAALVRAARLKTYRKEQAEFRLFLGFLHAGDYICPRGGELIDTDSFSRAFKHEVLVRAELQQAMRLHDVQQYRLRPTA